MSHQPEGSGGNIKGKVGGEIAAGKTFDVSDYSSTINYTSDSYDNANLVHEGAMSRRPGGSMRAGNWHTKNNSASGPDHICGKNGNPGKSRFSS